MLNPVVLIATHQRVDITTRNIESLRRQSLKPYILVVCSDKQEYEAYMNIDDLQVYAIKALNKPLGHKWQSGIQVDIYGHEANPLIICGSDDVLGDGFIENACRLINEGNHFIGLRQWWQHKDGKAYCCQYMTKDNFPLGGGRCYSAEMLKAVNYQLFDPTKDKHLDDLGWSNAQKTGLKCLVLNEPEKEGLSIHAIKGNWPVMNEFTLKHHNLRLIRTEESKKVLPEFYGNER